MKMTRLKGGSLSGTYLCEPEGQTPFVRKDVSLVHNREYGFQRWYSQLKRLQRYSQIVPDVFPRLITYGKTDDTAYFDMEYIEGALTAHEFLLRTTDHAQIDRMLQQLLKTMKLMHRVEIPSTATPLDLYIHEEIEQRIGACMGNARFQEFISEGDVYFNGARVPGLATVLDEYRALAHRTYEYTTETFTHGNITLENILYQPQTDRVIFIDPYEENVIDSVLAEYSQIRQSANSKYELYNSGTPRIERNRADMEISDYPGLNYFNDRFTEFLTSRHSANDLIAIRLLEVSQYARMLPFKMEVDEDKMLFFYALGSHLFHTLREEWVQS